jgi:ATP-dependent Clp protease protease subunit
MRGLTPARLGPEEEPKRPDRQFEVFSDTLQERSIFLNGAIDDTVSATLCAQLLFLESKDPERGIVFYINSPDGMVMSALAIYDIMQYIACPVSTVCMGTARSAGSLLLMAGAGRVGCPTPA